MILKLCHWLLDLWPGQYLYQHQEITSGHKRPMETPEPGPAWLRHSDSLWRRGGGGNNPAGTAGTSSITWHHQHPAGQCWLLVSRIFYLLSGLRFCFPCLWRHPVSVFCVDWPPWPGLVLLGPACQWRRRQSGLLWSLSWCLVSSQCSSQSLYLQTSPTQQPPKCHQVRANLWLHLGENNDRWPQLHQLYV